MRSAAVVVALGMLVSSYAEAVEKAAPPSVSAAPGSPEKASAAPSAAGIADRSSSISMPRDLRGNAPRTGLGGRFTRGSLAIGLGSAGFSSAVPIGSTAGAYRGRAGETSLTGELYGQRFGFNLDASANMGTSPETKEGVIPRSKVSSFAARGSGGTMLFASESVTFSAGLALEMRANAIGSLDDGNQFLTQWQTAVAGADVHGRVFVTQRIYLGASAFAGLVPIAGRWESMDVAAKNGKPGSGNLSNASVFAAAATASYRAKDRLAITAGIAARDGEFHLRGNSRLHEQTVKPYLAIEVLY